MPHFFLKSSLSDISSWSCPGSYDSARHNRVMMHDNHTTKLLDIFILAQLIRQKSGFLISSAMSINYVYLSICMNYSHRRWVLTARA